MVMMQIIEATADHVDYKNGGPVTRLEYSTIPGGAWNPQRIDRLRQALQDVMDVRTLRADLPPEDEDADFDPAREDIFWEGNQVVSRADVITAFVGGDGNPNFTVRAIKLLP